MFMAILAILLTLLLVVGVHEAGHALAAYLFRVKIEKISIGFGQPLLQWSANNMKWVLGLWPLGGYVLLLNSRISPLSPKDYPYCFDKKPIGTRCVILLAGVTANLIMAWTLFLLLSLIGAFYLVPQVQAPPSQSIAARAGVSAFDELVAIEGRLTLSWQKVGIELINFWGKKNLHLTLRSLKDDSLKQVVLDVSASVFPPNTRSLLVYLGLTPDKEAPRRFLRATSFVKALESANATLFNTLYFFVMVLKQLFTGTLPFSMLLGPLGLFAASVASLGEGLVFFMNFIALLSTAVAFINLLPPTWT